ncbi:HD domain-containing phosphohydrolase [Tomitella biformata]|uniref:HD domain-containing phosphohydrolase n=1 Tax=Tomitella biformata TaxID=630403 RepID=UPI0034E29582
MTRRLAFTFERWDGAGLPAGCRHEQIPLEVRIVHLSNTCEVFARARGTQAAMEMARSRRGTQFDPALADLFSPPASAPRSTGSSTNWRCPTENGAFAP